MKRLDLIFSERELDAIIKTLEKANVPGYTVMKHAQGEVLKELLLKIWNLLDMDQMLM